MAHAVVASALGLLGLPLVLGRSDPTGPRAWFWLVLATATAVWLVALAPVFALEVERWLARAPGASGARALDAQARGEITRLSLGAAYVILVQAIVRRPLVAVLGNEAEPFVIEACVAVVALLLLMLLLGFIHRAAKPLVEGLAWFTLDSLLATTGSEAASAQASASASTIGQPPTLPAHDVDAEPTRAPRTLVASARTVVRRSDRD